MADVLDLVARLAAFDAQRAVRQATHRQVAVQPHAIVICPLAMAGEDTTVHALAIGGIGLPAEIYVAGDPRDRDEQYDLIGWLGVRIEAYFNSCRMQGDFPQIWVSSGAAAGHLDILADRLRFTRDNPPIKRVGELLTYATERMPVAGQQALMTATGALATMFTTGQHSGDDEHLGVFLTWLSPPPGQSLQLAIAEAESKVMGVKTDPEFDRKDLQPLVKLYNDARDRPPAERQFRRQQITDILTPIAEQIYDGVQLAIRYLNGQPLPDAPVLKELRREEAQAFIYFMSRRDLDKPLPYRDSPRSGAFRIVEREHALQSMMADQPHGDAMAAARARWTGRLISGVVVEAGSQREGRKTVHRIVIETDQVNLHVRPRDQIAWISDPRLKMAVEDVRLAPTGSRLHVRIKAGHQSVGVPVIGTQMEVGAPPAEWGWMLRKRSDMRDRLAVMPWTHGDAPIPIAVPLAAPPNLAALVEALR